VNALCVDCFPVEYPRSWYEDITSNPKFYSLAAIHKSAIVGIIVAEIKLYIKLTPKVNLLFSFFLFIKMILEIPITFLVRNLINHFKLYFIHQ